MLHISLCHLYRLRTNSKSGLRCWKLSQPGPSQPAITPNKHTLILGNTNNAILKTGPADSPVEKVWIAGQRTPLWHPRWQVSHSPRTGPWGWCRPLTRTPWQKVQFPGHRAWKNKADQGCSYHSSCRLRQARQLVIPRREIKSWTVTATINNTILLQLSWSPAP